jgi:putative lipoprotein (rSAM/lipoprotein system)
MITPLPPIVPRGKPMRFVFRLLAGVVGGMLHLAGCSDSPVEPEYGPAAEYGAPHADYRISGRVVAAGTDQPIPGIEVAFMQGRADTTDAEGRWAIDTEWGPCADACAVQATDIDGPDNGAFAPAEVPLDLEQTEAGDGRWYLGRFEQHDLAIELDESPPPEPRP